jgi:glycosyltransferase involved in cell wall biosynthesis
MKRVLFLAYLFPPIANSGTQRSLKFVKYLSEHGWDPIVVTAANFDGHATDERLLDEIPRGVRVERVPMQHDRVGDRITSLLGGSSLAKRAGDAVRWRMREKHRVPDLYASWHTPVLNAAKKIFRDGGFDAVFATGFPWSALMAARAIAQETGRPFIADFRDLWAGDGWHRHERPSHDIELAMEREVVESASAVVCTSDTMCLMMSNAHPSVDRSRFVAIHNGFDAENFTTQQPPAAEAGRPFRIVYTGVWRDVYNPGAIYNTIDWIRRSEPDALNGVEVVAAGFKPGEARMRGLARYIKEPGPVPHKEAVSLMQHADLLYLSHDDPDRQWAVPGKLYEYLASGRPVMALTHAHGEAARILKRVGGGKVVLPDDPGNLYYALLDACRNKSVSVPPRDVDALGSLERRALTAKLAELLNEATSPAAMRTAAPSVSMPAAVIPRLRPR